MMLIKNTKNELKELLQKGFLCFVNCVQNLALNYDENDNIFETNLIKVPESFYKTIFKRNSIYNTELDNSQIKIRKFSDSSFAFENSSNSIIISNLDQKINKNEGKGNININNYISSIEDSYHDKSIEDRKIKESDLNVNKYKNTINNANSNKEGKKIFYIQLIFIT